MYCNDHLTSTCLCGCDNASTYPTSLRSKSSTARRESFHISSCSCKYNPFTDEAKDTEIRDLEFALRKLTVMKCQMKKWRIERLQLESELRSLKKKLQSLGVDVQNVAAEDPLLVHYRDENDRLERIIEQLEEKIKDMEMTINNPELHKNPGQGIQKIRDKMRILHEQSNREIRKSEERKKKLLNELAGSNGESPCAGVNRLRARLRELMNQLNDRKIADNKRQPDTIALSRSCDDLRIENERLRVENQDLRRALTPAGNDVDIGKSSAISNKFRDGRINVVETEEQGAIPGPSISQQKDSDIEMKLRECNYLIRDLRREIIEKDDMIQTLQRTMAHDMETMRVNHETLIMQAGNDKVQLKKCEEKVGRLLTQLSRCSPAALESDRFASQMNDENEYQSEERAPSELTTLKRELDQLIVRLDEVDRDNNNLRTERDALKHQIAKKGEIQLENESLKQRIADMMTDLDVQENEFSMDPHEIAKLNQELENTRTELQLSQNQISGLMNELSESQIENDEWDALEKALTEEQLAKNAALKKIATLNDELYALKSELKNCRDGNEELWNDLNNTKRQCTQLNEDVIKYQSEVEALKNDAEKLKEADHQNAKIEADTLKIDNATLKGEGERLRSENSEIQKDLKNLEDINKNLSSELDTLRKTLSDSEAQLRKSESSFNALISEKQSLLAILSSMRMEMEELKKKINIKDIELEEAAAVKQELIALKNELKKCREELERCKHHLNSSKEHVDKLRSANGVSKRESIIADKKTDVDKVHEDLEKESGAAADRTILEEMKALKNTLGKLMKDLEKCNMENGRLHSELDKWKNDAEILKTESRGLKDENIKVVGELKAVKNKLGHLNREMDEMNLQNSRLERDLMMMRKEMESTMAVYNKLEVENAAMKKNIDELSREPKNYVGDVSELEGEIARLKMENKELKTEIETVHKGFASVSSSREKITNGKQRVEENVSSGKKHRKFGKLQDEMEYLRRENEKLSKNLEKLKHDIDKLETENDILKTDINEWKRIVENLKKENIKMSGGYDEDGVESDRSKRDMQLHPDTPDILNELLKALDVIRMEIEKQKKGVMRIRENIDNMDKQIWPDSSEYTESDNPIVLNTTNPVVAEVFQLLGSLSTNISRAEKELINFGEVYKTRWQEKDSQDVGTSETPRLSYGRTARDAGSFDPESWLASLALTQLAELHDKICLLTSNMVVQDISPDRRENPGTAPSSPRNQNNLQHNYDVLNTRIAALQREIQEKQIEAGRKVFEMRQLLRREQAELLRISEIMNREKKRNLILQFEIDEPPCRVFDCTANCAKSAKLIRNIARG